MDSIHYISFCSWIQSSIYHVVHGFNAPYIILFMDSIHYISCCSWIQCTIYQVVHGFNPLHIMLFVSSLNNILLTRFKPFYIMLFIDKILLPCCSYSQSTIYHVVHELNPLYLTLFMDLIHHISRFSWIQSTICHMVFRDLILNHYTSC